jgi:CHASE3 domain sensor protein/GAF domain-containing protein
MGRERLEYQGLEACRTMSTKNASLLSRYNFLNNLKIGQKLNMAFGILVVLTLLVVGLSYLGSFGAIDKITRTDEVRVPSALTASRAQTNLLRMLDDVYVYLAIGDPHYRDQYEEHSAAFKSDLAELDRLSRFSPDAVPMNRAQLVQLKDALEHWSALPDQLFELRDDQLEREPAYKILATDGLRLGGTILIDVNTMIDAQGRREPSAENISVLAEMAKFQGSFASMLSGLRGYVTTHNRNYHGEYEANRTLNDYSWGRLQSQRGSLSPDQQSLLDNIAKNRDAFLQLPDKIFAELESDHWRKDLYLFKTQAVPLADTMLGLLNTITTNEQDRLKHDLSDGRFELTLANQQTLAGGIIALLLAVTMAYLFRQNIAGPIRRLTAVAEQVRHGDLAARAVVESGDEIGTLAGTFNRMTSQIQHMLRHLQIEKKRADDLLDVVIPIGVALSSEKDFNRLLEKILSEARAFCNADAGSLYLRTQDNCLKFVLVHNDSQKIVLGGASGGVVPFAPIPLYDEVTGAPRLRNVAANAAINGRSINIPDARTSHDFDFEGLNQLDDSDNHYARSFLTIPLKNSADDVLGVLQLLNAQDPDSKAIIPFDDNLQQMVESLSSLAVAALEAYIREQGLRREIQQLRIEIDEAKRQKQVSEIVDTDFFVGLKTKARKLRDRGRDEDKNRQPIVETMLDSTNAVPEPVEQVTAQIPSGDRG